MRKEITDIVTRLQLCFYPDSLDSIFLAADTFALSRQQERGLVRMFCDNEPVRPALIEMADLDDDFGIDWQTSAGCWVLFAIKEIKAQEARQNMAPGWALRVFLYNFKEGQYDAEIEAMN
ncbi:MAG: hypothetical protein RI601_12690 [Desulfurivibrionaceae bacterium]|nr:hypothetical protein [Desulfurivibrionaceae bacterium]